MVCEARREAQLGKAIAVLEGPVADAGDGGGEPGQAGIFAAVEGQVADFRDAVAHQNAVHAGGHIVPGGHVLVGVVGDGPGAGDAEDAAVQGPGEIALGAGEGEGGGGQQDGQ